MSSGPDEKAGKYRQPLMLLLIAFLFWLLSGPLMFMLSAFLGALALYIVLRKPHMFLRRRYRLTKPLATLALLLASLFLVLIPLYFTGRFLVLKIEPVLRDTAHLVQALETINAYINRYVEFSLISPGNLNRISSLAQTVLPAIFDSGVQLLSNLVMMYFLLWFMLNNRFAMERHIRIYSPFGRKNTRSLSELLKTSVSSNMVGILILGLIQGLVAMLGYWIFGLNEPVLWGLITGVSSVIPFVGTMLAWIPLSILTMAGGDLWNGIGIFCYGLFIIGSSDNVFRFMLQKRLASTHPVITVLGVIAGLSLMGFWGLVYGPLLISLLIRLGGIYLEEFGKGKPSDKKRTCPETSSSLTNSSLLSSTEQKKDSTA